MKQIRMIVNIIFSISSKDGEKLNSPAMTVLIKIILRSLESFFLDICLE